MSGIGFMGAFVGEVVGVRAAMVAREGARPLHWLAGRQASLSTTRAGTIRLAGARKGNPSCSHDHHHSRVRAGGLFIRRGCGCVHGCSLFFLPVRVDANGSEKFGRVRNA